METNPQAREMADASMLRTLAWQAEAIWPQEAPLFDRYGSPGRILDVGCGPGEISARLLERFPAATLTGCDIDGAHLARARSRCGPRATFVEADVLNLPFEPGSFDLVVCRHVLQAVPAADEVVRSLRRLLRPGGWLHLLAEDYGMIHFPVGGTDPDRFWHHGSVAYMRATGTDGRVGRHIHGVLHGLAELRCDYVVVDTLRVKREVFAGIWEAWRDGYTASLVEKTLLPRDEVEASWREMLAALRDPAAYAVWHIPIWSGKSA